MLTNVPASVNDVAYELHWTFIFSRWSVGSRNEPVISSIIGEFCFEHLGWRWDNWLFVIMGGVTICLVAGLGETYLPVWLRKKAAKMREETNEERWWSRYENKERFWQLLRINLSRPFTMIFTEPIWFVVRTYAKSANAD